MTSITNTGGAAEAPLNPEHHSVARLDLEPHFRRASPDDARAMAELVNIAGEGLPLHLWGKMAKLGEDPWDVGRQRARREEGGFSYRNAVFREEDGRVAACLVGYKQPDLPVPIDYDTMPLMFVGLQELENLAPGTWYVNVLATYPEHRRKGYGTELLTLAERCARVAGATGLSIIVADANEPARRLYERMGCREVAGRTIVKGGWETPAKTWVLLVKNL